MDKHNVVCIYNGIIIQLLSRRKFWPMLSMGEAWRPYAKWSMSETKEPVWYDSGDIRFLEQASSSQQKAELWLPGTMEREK